MISVYIAARWETKDDAAKLRDELAKRGIGCTSRWLEEEPSLGDIPVEKKRHVALMDVYDVRRAQALVLWNPAEKHRVGTGGCHTEVGMAFAAGMPVPVFVVGYDPHKYITAAASNVFHFLPGVLSHFLFPRDVDLLVECIKASVVDFGPTWDSPKEQERTVVKRTVVTEPSDTECLHVRSRINFDRVRNCLDCDAAIGGMAP